MLTVRQPPMNFIFAVFLIIFSPQLVQLVTCVPFGSRFTGPNPNQGVGCGTSPGRRQYCDKFGSGNIKNCSPCNVEQLSNPDISFPKECADLPCPYRCPEEISDWGSPAPRDSCDVPTTSWTTSDATTTTTSSTAYVYETPTLSPTKEALSASTSTSRSETTSVTYDDWASHVRVAVIIAVIVGIVVVVILLTVLCIRKRKLCKLAIVLSSSTEPMIAPTNDIEMAQPQTPTSPIPVFIPGQTSVHITTNERNMHVKLDCNCAGQPIHTGTEGSTCTLDGLLPSTRYDVVVGTLEDNVFHNKYHRVIETTGENPVRTCTFSLQSLKNHIEMNSQDFQFLKTLFGHVKTETAQGLAILRDMSKVLGVISLTDVAGLKLLEEMISIDGELKEEEDSVKIYSIQLALRCNMKHSAHVPEFVADISQKLSSIHKECLPCRHLVCQVMRNSSETYV